jgi:uncharacterized RDD family membrane protein YckC
VDDHNHNVHAGGGAQPPEALTGFKDMIYDGLIAPAPTWLVLLLCLLLGVVYLALKSAISAEAAYIRKFIATIEFQLDGARADIRRLDPL